MLTTTAKAKAEENTKWRSTRVIKRFVTEEEMQAERIRRLDAKEAEIIEEEHEQDRRRDAAMAKATAKLAKEAQDTIDIEAMLKKVPAAARQNKSGAKTKAKKAIASYFPIADNDDDLEESVTEIAKLRYFEKTNDTVAYFEGLKILPGGATKLISLLRPSWVKDRFDPKFVRLVVVAGQRQHTMKVWVDIPVGNREEDNLPPSALLAWCWVKYPQKDLDGCLFRSFASACYQIGELHLGEQVACAAIRSLTLPARQQLEQLVSVVEKHHPTYKPQKYMKRHVAAKLNVLEDISPGPTVVVPLGMDGGVAHAVTIAGQLLFDSTCERVLILSLDALNWVCTADNGYAKVYMAVRFKETK
jgi:hypothetical protein